MKYHEPVLLKEALALLKPSAGGLYVDANLGHGGHTLAILKASAPNGQVLAFEWDEAAIIQSQKRLKEFKNRVKIFSVNFKDMFHVFKNNNLRKADGVFFDLGVNSCQIDSPQRGFSYLKDGPLDMRMNLKTETSAADLLAESSREKLEKIIFDYGQEPQTRKIVRAIKSAGEKITTTGQLQRIITSVLSGQPPQIIQRSVMRTFQALRIAVNHELQNLKEGLEAALEILKPGGRLVVISFHSLEDRIVKEFFVREVRDCICPPRIPVCVCRHQARLSVINRKVIIPQETEIKRNPRSHSAKLRAAERRNSS